MLTALVFLLSIAAALAGSNPARNPVPTNQWAVRLQLDVPGSIDEAKSVASELGLIHETSLPFGGDFHVLSHPSLERDLPSLKATHRETISRTESVLRSHEKVAWFEQQIKRWKVKRFNLPTDPLYGQQWHLSNVGQSDGTAGVDINITSSWLQGHTGKGIRLAIVDDGLQHEHPDLHDNYVSELSHNFNSGPAGDPSPNVNADFHGTSCAGVAGAGTNSVCGVGAAPEVGLVGLRLIAEGVTDVTEATALSWKSEEISIYSNSWGPEDDGLHLEGPNTLVRQVLEYNTRYARKELGSIFVWAGGNGGLQGDDCNYDGYANSPYTIAIGAIDNNGKQSWYSEPCAALVVSAPSSGDSVGITTTDLQGKNGYSNTDCTSDFGGTSSACPLVAGSIAVILEAHPSFSWRDIIGVLINSAVKTDPGDKDWTVNGAGLHINHKYGFGRINVGGAIELGKSWTKYKYLNIFSSDTLTVNLPIPESDKVPKPISTTFEVTQEITAQQVRVFIDATHPSSTDLEIVLVSPAGTKSNLASLHGVVVVPSVSVSSPGSIAGDYSASGAEFGADTTIAVSAPLKLVPGDGLGCDPFTGFANSIALISRGTCTFTQKAFNAQQAGAVGVIIYNNQAGNPINMAGSNSSITIPVVMIPLETGDSFKTALTQNQVDITITQSAYKSSSTQGRQYQNWGFTSFRHWGESAKGTWTLQVLDKYVDGVANSTSGTLNSWALEIFFDSETAAPPLPPLPSELGGGKHGGSQKTTVIVVVCVVLGTALLAAGIVFFVRYRKAKREALLAEEFGLAEKGEELPDIDM